MGHLLNMKNALLFRLITAELVGAQVFVVKSGTDKCQNKCTSRRGTISAVSKTSYYIAYETMVVIASTTSSSMEGAAQSEVKDSHTPSLETLAANNSQWSGGDSYSNFDSNGYTEESSPRECNISGEGLCSANSGDSAPLSMNDCEDNKDPKITEAVTDMHIKADIFVKKKELTWAPGVVVKRVLKSTSVIAVLMPPQKNGSSSKRDKESGAVQEANNGRICLLHGIHHMPFTNQTIK